MDRFTSPGRLVVLARRAGQYGVALGALALAAPGGGAAGPGAEHAIVLVNHQPFAIRMPMSATAGEAAAGHLSVDGAPVQEADDRLVFIGSVEAGGFRRLALKQGASVSATRRLTVEAADETVRMSFDREPMGRLSWSVHVSPAPPLPAAGHSPGPPDVAATFDPLPLAFTRHGEGPVFDTWTASGSRDGVTLALVLRAYHAGFLDIGSSLTTEPDAQTTGVYVAVVSRWEQPDGTAERRICYDNRIRSLAGEDRTPYRAGTGRHHFVQRGVDWAATRTAGGGAVLWLNDFAESFTVFEESSTNRFRQPRYLGANLPQLGSEVQATPDALFSVTEIARRNIASYHDRLIDNILPPPGERVSFATRLVFHSEAVSDGQATEHFIAYTGYSREDRVGQATEITFGVPDVRFGTSYFPYSTLGENFDRLKLPGMSQEGYWPLAADTVTQWPLFADAIQRDVRIAKAMGFHVIRLHYLDVIAALPAAVQRAYLDFLFAELRHLRLKAMLSPSDARFTAAQIADMVSRYRDVVESVEIENEILIWGIPQDRPPYWRAVYAAVKAVAPDVQVHLTGHTNTGIFTRLEQLGVPFDRIAGHAYIDSLDSIPSGRGFALAVGNYAAKAGKPAVITEWNWRGLTRLTPEARAKVYPGIIGGALESRAIGEFHQFQFQETLTVNPRTGRSGIRHYEPLRLSRRPKPEAFELMALMRRFVAPGDPIRRLHAPHTVTALDRDGRATATIDVTNQGTRAERLRAAVETPSDLRAVLASPAEIHLPPGATVTFTVRLQTRGRAPGFYHWFLRLQTAEGPLRYIWSEARLTATPAFDMQPPSPVEYPDGAAVIDLDYTRPVRVVYGQQAPVLEMEAAHVLAGTLESASGRPVEIYQLEDVPPDDEPGTLILVGTAASHALVAQVSGRLPSSGSFVQRVVPPAGTDAAWLIVGGADSRAVEDAALDYVLRYWRLARDSAARRVGLVEKSLPRTVDPAKLPDRIP